MKNLESLIAALTKTASEFFEQQATQANTETIAQDDYVIGVKISKEGDLSAVVSWPVDASPADIIRRVSLVVNGLGEKRFIQGFINAIQRYGETVQQRDIAQYIIHEIEKVNPYGNDVFVDPLAVFRIDG